MRHGLRDTHRRRPLIASELGTNGYLLVTAAAHEIHRFPLSLHGLLGIRAYGFHVGWCQPSSPVEFWAATSCLRVESRGSPSVSFPCHLETRKDG